MLALTYVLSLIFALKTHKDLYLGTSAAHEEAVHMKQRTALLLLLGATGLIAWMSELLVHSVEAASQTIGITKIFIGVIVVAVIGNAAEHSTAVMVAFKNQMDLAFHIAVGSSMQIALFVAPTLVFLGYAVGQPMDLLFTGFEVVTVGLAVAIVSLVAVDGETNWMEGILLLAVYLIFALAFYFCLRCTQARRQHQPPLRLCEDRDCRRSRLLVFDEESLSNNEPLACAQSAVRL